MMGDLVHALVEHDVRDPRVLDAFRSVPRAPFVPPDQRERAELDIPLPIPHGQVTTQPSLIAMMLEALQLRGDERVLEVGTGYGYQTALLAHLAREVISIERFADVAATARRSLASLPNVHVLVGDGSLGVPEQAPYDAIITSAAAPQVPPALIDELVEGGRLVHPLGPGGQDTVIAWLKHDARLVCDHAITHAHFVPMAGEFGART